MSRFNLSEWALSHRSLVWYFMLVSLAAGLMAYINLGREEDPAFAIKTMVISAAWPGATAEETSRQITERIERKVEELDSLKFTRSLTTSGRTIVYVDLQDTVRGEEVRNTWIRVRNMISDIQLEFPQGVVGPFFNDRFGDVYGNIYAFTSDGLSERELRDRVEETRSKLLTVPNIGAISILGAQEEKVYVEFSTAELAAFGVNPDSVIQTLQAQTAVRPSGVVNTDNERIALRIGGQSSSVEQLRSIILAVDDQLIRLGDVATISKGYVDPPETLFRYNGEAAIGIAIGMKQGANLLEFGKALDVELEAIRAELPLGVEVHKVADQPEMVDTAIGHFTRALFEAVAIVLAISFISLGVRAGLVVTVSIPLVLAITFTVLNIFDITLQRISLGALIIALGLLVDDAMIAVEMMIARLEVGDTLNKAATYVYTSTAFPMLTGTLVTVAGFIPIGLNPSSAGEFTFTLFVVIAVSLVVSWIVAVLFTPLLGVALLPKTLKHKGEGGGRFSKGFSATLRFCLHFRWLTIGISVLALLIAVYSFQFVQQEFFPSSDRPELVVQFDLVDGASINATNAQMKQFEDEVLSVNEEVLHWSTYVGEGAPRFLLAFESPLPSPSVGQIIVMTRDLDSRDRARQVFESYIERNFISSEVAVTLLSLGPPTGKPVQYRISGSNIDELRQSARDLAGIVAGHANVRDTSYDWIEPARVVRARILPNKSQRLGVSPTDIADALSNASVGAITTQVRDGIYLIDVVGRIESSERTSIETLKRINVYNAKGVAVPLESVVIFEHDLEQPVIWRRSRVPTITIKANTVGGVQPATIVAQLEPAINEFSDGLPRSVNLALGGAVEDSAEAQGPIVSAMPLMLLFMATILMIQLQSFQRLFLVFAIAPFAIIGVVLALLPSGIPMGFVAILGILALIGILIRNSVILIVQIEDLRTAGTNPWHAVVEATEHRMRPILLTAAAASLALIPISRDVFWGPMAYAMMGGIIVGTILTLLFLPALYVAWFRIPRADVTM